MPRTTVVAESLEDRLLLFALGPRWSATATDGTGLTQGTATTITWSIVPDGTPIRAMSGLAGESSDPSNLVSYLNGVYGTVTADRNYTDEIWFGHMKSVFDRWSAASGVSYVYTAADDGATFGSAAGLLGVRGDVRIGGHRIDGNSSVLAYNFYPNNGEMVIDTTDTSFPSTGNAIRFRNMMAHESGHGLGLRHITSSTSAFLMEGTLSTSFDGPQLDDILGVQRLYGDFYEKNGGNDTAAKATSLGSLNSGQTISIGTAGASTIVTPLMTDFVSVDDESDVDFYRFTVDSAASVSLNLKPTGAAYNVGLQGGVEALYNAAAQSNLSLQIYKSDGTSLLATANSGGIGASESLSNISLPAAGTYFVRVTGATTDRIQLYQLGISRAELSVLPGLLINDVSVQESAGSAIFTVTLDAVSSTDVSFRFTTNANSAKAVSDFVATSGNRTIPAGQRSVTFSVPIVNDSIREPHETFYATLSDPRGATILKARGRSTIADDDGVLSLKITSTSISEGDGVPATTGIVTSSSTTFGAGNVVVSVTVTENGSDDDHDIDDAALEAERSVFDDRIAGSASVDQFFLLWDGADGDRDAEKKDDRLELERRLRILPGTSL